MNNEHRPTFHSFATVGEAFDAANANKPPFSSPPPEERKNKKEMDKSTKGFFKALMFSKVLEVARLGHKELSILSNEKMKKGQPADEQIKMMEQMDDIIDRVYGELMGELNRYEKMVRDL